jgi:hypothetical protein
MPAVKKPVPRSAPAVARNAGGTRTRERTPVASACRACSRALATPRDFGWECECGVVICTDPDCFEEYFKPVAGGEATRCLSCGLLT